MGLGTACPTVFDEDTDMVAVARNIARFFKNESCGQCTPCREGSGLDLQAHLAASSAATRRRRTSTSCSRSRAQHGHHPRHHDLRPRRWQQLGDPHDRRQVPRRVRGARANPYSVAVGGIPLTVTR
jgi:hypothetical protein